MGHRRAARGAWRGVGEADCVGHAHRARALETLFWAAFSIASETLTTTSAQLAGTSVAGIAAPAALQVAVLDMYHAPTKQVVPKLMRGEVAALLDDASLAGTIGAVVAKSYAP